MQTRSATLLLVAIDPSVAAMVEAAARLAFAPLVVAPLPGVEHALQRAQPAGDELLVLLDPTPADAAQAREAKDPEGLSRWPVLVLSAAPAAEKNADLECLPRELWSPPVLARAFHGAASRHRLIRENQRALGDLLTVARRVTHDLRSPLSGVVSTAEMLKEILAETEPQAASLTGPLFRSVDGMVQLLERVGLLLGATSRPPALEQVDVGLAVSNTLQRLERVLSEKKIQVQKPASWPEIRGVETWVEAIWLNLIRNALQHAKDLSRIDLGWEQLEGACRFWVRDDSQGIPMERRKRLFQPFHLLHEPGAARGLGLATVQRLVELQGGACGHETAESGGSSFHFTLPQA